jgi:hypothetical protein
MGQSKCLLAKKEKARKYRPLNNIKLGFDGLDLYNLQRYRVFSKRHNKGKLLLFIGWSSIHEAR